VSAVFAEHKSVFEKAYPSCVLGLCETKRPGANFALVKEGSGTGGSIHATAALGDDGMTLAPTMNSEKRESIEIKLPPEAVSALRKAQGEFIGLVEEENVLARMLNDVGRRLNAAMDFAGTVCRMGRSSTTASKNPELEALRAEADSAIEELERNASELMTASGAFGPRPR
jgi:hypothetical protein